MWHGNNDQRIKLWQGNGKQAGKSESRHWCTVCLPDERENHHERIPSSLRYQKVDNRKNIAIPVIKAL